MKNVIRFLGLLWVALLAAQGVFGQVPVSTAQLESEGATVSRDPTTGRVQFVGYGTDALSRRPVQPTLQSVPAKDVAKSVLQAHANLFGLTAVASETQEVKHRDDATLGSMTRYRQLVNGVPVIGGELIVNLTTDRRLRSISGKTTVVPKLDTTPRITAEAATQVAVELMNKQYGTRLDELILKPPVLEVFDAQLFTPLDRPVSLVWHLDIRTTRKVPINEFILVDAHSGEVALNFNQAPRARNRMTYDANNVPGATTGPLSCNESNPSCSGGSTDAVQAHKYAGNTYDYYFNNFSRDSIDGAGMSLISVVQICPAGETCPYANAYWDGAQMSYGDGYAAGEDVVAHELTHGVTEHESGLIYAYQSGAINESLSDVFGELVQQSNLAEPVSGANRWKMGENLSIGAIRSMSDPTIYSDPDRMGSPLYYTGTGDNGGVHINSGVNNKATFLMVDGGSFNGRTVTGIGLAKTGRIYYRAQTHYLVSSSDYLALYNALNQSCQDLIGTAGISSGDCNQVTTALQAVEMNGTTSVTRTLSVSKSGTGTVTADRGGISCGATCSAAYPVGATVTLTATPGAGQILLGWSGGCSGAGTCTVTMSAAKSVTATFGPGVRVLLNAATNLSAATGAWSGTYNFNIPSGATNLSIAASGGTGDADLYVKFGAVPDLSNWDCRPYLNGNDEVCAFPTPSVGTYYARLYAYEAYAGLSFNVSYVRQPTLTVAKAGTGSGTVTSSVGGISCGATCSATITGGTSVTLTATPASGSVFAGWSGACTGTGTCTTNMAGDTNVTATFNTGTASGSKSIVPILMLLLD